MKLALSSFNLPKNLTGGVEVHTWELAKELSHLDVEVHLFFASSFDYEYLDPDTNVYLHSLRIPYWNKIDVMKKRIGLPIFNMKINNKVRNNEFDIFHSQNFDGIAFLSSNIPTIITIHTVPFCRYVKSRKTLPKSILNTGLMYMEHIKCNLNRKKSKYISVSEYVQKDLKRYYDIDSSVIPNGANVPDKVSKEIARSKLDITNWGKVILFFSRITKEKGPHKLLDILDEQDDTELLVAGDGPFLAGLRELIDERSLSHKVKLMGYVSPDMIKYIFSAADCFALPSDQIEGQPITILEAMSYGLPCYVTDSNWVPYYLRDFCFDGDLNIGIANALKTGHKDICVMTWKDVAKETKKVYRSVINTYD